MWMVEQLIHGIKEIRRFRTLWSKETNQVSRVQCQIASTKFNFRTTYFPGAGCIKSVQLKQWFSENKKKLSLRHSVLND